jgi:uroporphyrinogen-III synthase
MYGLNAQRALDAAEAEVRSIPVGEVKADVLQAHSVKAQVFTSAAIAHALLEIGDVLRTALAEGVPSDG